MIQLFESFLDELCQLSDTHSHHSLQSSSSLRSVSGEQQQRCNIVTSLAKQLTSSPAERLLLRVPVGRVLSCPPVSASAPSVLCPPSPPSRRPSCRFCFPAHLPSRSLRTVPWWWLPSVLVVAAVAVWIGLCCVLLVVSRVSSFFRLVLLPPPLCGWSAVVVVAICCVIGHGCSECGSCFLTRDWLGAGGVSRSS